MTLRLGARARSGTSCDLKLNGGSIGTCTSDGFTATFTFDNGDSETFDLAESGMVALRLPGGENLVFRRADGQPVYVGEASAAAVAKSGPTVTCVTTTPEPSASPSASPSPVTKCKRVADCLAYSTSSPEVSSDEVFSPTPIAGTNPFQCGFEFPSDEHAADTFSVTGGKVPASQMQALLTEKLGAKAPTLNADSAYALMWSGKMLGDASESSVNAAAADSLSYVLAVDGVVIGTFERGPDGAMDGVSVADDSDSAVAGGIPVGQARRNAVPRSNGHGGQGADMGCRRIHI